MDGPDEGRRQVMVLGPTRLDGRAPSPRQRSLVAALAFHRHRGVDPDRLIDAVWDGDPPRSARASMQNQVARLRRDHGEDVVRTVGGRYHLDRPCDADEWEGSVTQWLEHPTERAAIAPLRVAREWWRGEPYVELDDLPDVVAERRRLGELRSLAEEQLAACSLAAGDVARTTADLVGLTAAEPYRERRWELLLVALHLAGRRADALAAFHRCAYLLERDLGVRPSTSLRALRDRIEAEADVDVGAALQNNVRARHRTRGVFEHCSFERHRRSG